MSGWHHQLPEMLRRGMNLADIAREVGVSRQRVQQVAKDKYPEYRELLDDMIDRERDARRREHERRVAEWMARKGEVITMWENGMRRSEIVASGVPKEVVDAIGLPVARVVGKDWDESINLASQCETPFEYERRRDFDRHVSSKRLIIAFGSWSALRGELDERKPWYMEDDELLPIAVEYVKQEKGEITVRGFLEWARRNGYRGAAALVARGLWRKAVARGLKERVGAAVV